MMTALMVGTATLSMVAAAVAPASAQAASANYQIASQPLGQALMQLSRQANVDIVAPARLTRGRTAGAVAAESVDAALRQMLAGTGLSYKANGRRYVIQAGSGSSAGAMQASPASNDGESKKSSSSGEDVETAEIVVTAQKREERLQNVPISITALSGRTLESSTSTGVSEALESVPGVVTLESQNGIGSQLNVRGVGTSGPWFNGSTPVAYYLDSVPFGLIRTSVTPDSGAYDLQRVEVLRGPQGTLYGASALNGVVRILTAEPDLGRVDFKARGTLSTTKYGGENYRADMALNLPVIEDVLGVRIGGGYQDYSGWIDRPGNRDANRSDLTNFRFKAKFKPIERLTIDFTTWLSRADFDAPSTGTDEHKHLSPGAEPSTSDYDVYGLRVNYEFDTFAITSSSSYLDFRATSVLNYVPFCGAFCAFTTDTDFKSKVFAQEALISSTTSGPWKWSFGGFYRDAKDGTVQNTPSFATGLPDDLSGFDDRSQSIAAFGEVTRAFADGRLELTGGLRYFRDRVKSSDNAPSGTLRQRDVFKSWSPRVVLTWRPDRTLTVYSSFSKGFRSGVLQAPLAAAVGVPAAEPDSLYNYEVGAKGSLWGGAVTFDAAAYYIDWKKVQQSIGILINGLLYNTVANAAAASGPGIDLSVTAHPSERASFGINFSTNDLELDSNLLDAGTVVRRKGDRLSSSPKYTGSIFANYNLPLGGDFEGRFAFSASFVSKYETPNASIGGLAVIKSDEQLIGRGSFTLAAPRGWEATLFVDNVFNEQGISGVNTFGVPSWQNRPRPRTIGLQLEYHLR